MDGTLARACGIAAPVTQMVVLESSSPTDLLQALFSMCYSLPGSLGPGRLAVKGETLKGKHCGGALGKAEMLYKAGAGIDLGNEQCWCEHQEADSLSSSSEAGEP